MVCGKMFWFEDPAFANKISTIVYGKYRHLGKKGKPETGREWTTLAAVVGVFEKQEGQGIEFQIRLYCVRTFFRSTYFSFGFAR